MRSLAPALTLIVCLCPRSNGQFPAEYRPLQAEAEKATTLRPNLAKLTDEIGGRIPGTPAMDAAVAWAMDAFKAAGADTVRTEPFTMRTGWLEGPTAVNITAPVSFPVRAVSIVWSPNVSLTAKVMDLGSGSEQDFAKAGDLTGSIALIHSEVLKNWEGLFNDYLQGPPIVERAVAAKAAAIAWTSTREHDILYRHINAAPGEYDSLPSVLLAREDAERIARLIASGREVRMRVVLQNRLSSAVKTANVVAEIRGSEKPDEWVLLGAHLDSWDLGTGALDNGCNAAMLIEVVRAMKASGFKPRRSIRFVLFSGEEQWMIGSREYVKAHVAEMSNAIAAAVFDSGAGKATGYSLGGRKDIKAKIDRMMQPFPGAAMNTLDAPVGTDNLDFLLQGVPTLILNQEESNYLENYHAVSDTFDKVDFAELTRNLQIASYTAAWIANQPDRLGPRQTRFEIARLLKETGMEDQLKIFHQWSDWEKGFRGRIK